MVSHQEHHKRELMFLISLLMVFFILFIISLINIKKEVPIFGIGLPYLVENLVIMLLSVIGIVKVLWHIIVH